MCEPLAQQTRYVRLTLSNKVCWEVALEELLILKGVMQLGIGHASRLEPAVKNLVHAPQDALPLLTGNC